MKKNSSLAVLGMTPYLEGTGNKKEKVILRNEAKKSFCINGMSKWESQNEAN